LTLKDALHDRPVLYEVVPPRREPSKFETELRGLDGVLGDKRVNAINVPELFDRLEQGGGVTYAPTTILPEEYARIIGSRKETVVNIVAPRLPKKELLARLRRISDSYGIRNAILVGKERKEDALPGPNVLEAIELVHQSPGAIETLGGICIFDRNSKFDAAYGSAGSLDEHQRALAKTRAGCDFLTSQIIFDPEPPVRFMSSYQQACQKAGLRPATVFVSLSTTQSQTIVDLMDKLDVAIPSQTRKRILQSSDPGKESVDVATEVFQEVIENFRRDHIRVPVGLQVEQVGVNSAELTLELLDRTYPILKGFTESDP
jgi:5,10-methylenetetrahydrofolate reductase